MLTGKPSPSLLRLQPSHAPVRGRERNASPPPYRFPGGEKSSLDLTQRFERKLAGYNASQNVFKRWLFEIISWVISAVCMAAIVGILLYIKDKPLKMWPMALTINNVLSKVASAALILPISEAIGQLKWSWFNGSKSRDIVDFEIYDKASRGAWGSFLLLFRTKGRSLAALGAVLTLLLLATDTFFQQVTDLPELWIQDGFGEIPRVVRYEGDNGVVLAEGVPLLLEEINLREITFKYFYYNGTESVAFGNGTRPEIPLTCPSSKCEWNAYESLGVCSSCTDASDLLTYGCLTARLDWPANVFGLPESLPNGTACGYWLNATSSEPLLMSGYIVNDTSNHQPGETLIFRTVPLVQPPLMTTFFGGSINYKHINYPFIDALIVGSADGSPASVHRNERPVAQECMLTWCVKSIMSSYSEGNYKEEVLDTYFNITEASDPYPWTVYEAESFGEPAWDVFVRDNITIYPPSMDATDRGYGVSNETFARTSVLFDNMFPSSITVAHAAAQPLWKVDIRDDQLNLRPVDYCPWLAPNDVGRYIARLATAMTNIVRSHRSNEFVSGRAYSRITFIAVHWGWMSLPLVLLILSLVFLVATMVKTSKGTDGGVAMWKTSTLPTLMYGLPKAVQRDLSPSGDWKNGTSRKADRIRVKLLPNHGWRVSGGNEQQAPPGWI